MYRFVPSVVLLALALPALAEDVFVPPVPIGVLKDGRTHAPKHPLRFPAENERWIHISSAHYDVISSAPESRTREIVGDLESLAAALRNASTRFQNGSAQTTVFIFAHRDELQPLFDLLLNHDDAPVTGTYVRSSHASGTMFIDATSRGRIDRTAMHELVHDLLRQSAHVPPLWLEEGLAEYFGNAEVRDGTVLAGSSIPEHVQLIRHLGPMPASVFFDVTAETDAALAPLFYASSWAAVDWLMHRDAAAFYAFLQDVEGGAKPADALQARFGKSVRDLDRAIANGGGGRRMRLDATSPAQPSSAVDVDRATILYDLGRFLSHVPGSENEAARFFAEALRVNPQHAPTLVALGRYEEAVAADPKDGAVKVMYAESLLGPALGEFAGVFEPHEGDEAKFRKARELAERGIELGANEARAEAVIGTSYLVEADVTPGLVHLEKARAADPSRSDVALNLFAMYLRAGDRARAEELFESALARSNDKQVVFAARSTLLRAETDRANSLAKAGKLADAAAVVRGLAATIDDANARAELERQAAELEQLSAVNQHITMYNQAVAAANAGRTREAIAALDRLLAVATDPQVVRDAQRFRAELRKR